MKRPLWVEPVEQLAGTVAGRWGLSLVGVDVLGEGRRTIVRVSVEGPEGEAGPTIERCAEVAEELGRALDLHDPIPYAYTLEVASPGLDRPLRRPEDFERYRGRKVEIVTGEPIGGRRRWKGRLLGLEGDVVVVEIDAQRAHVPLALVTRAHLVVEMEDLREDFARGGRATP